jgi:hypothetical protein
MVELKQTADHHEMAAGKDRRPTWAVSNVLLIQCSKLKALNLS